MDGSMMAILWVSNLAGVFRYRIRSTAFAIKA